MPSLSRLEFLVEEPSVEAALSYLVPKLLGPDFPFSVYPHQGKRDLLKKLPARELQRAGHHQGGLAKIRAAREISVCMEPDRNRSRSFQVFRQGLLDLTGASE
jgi:hypothetical protein